MQADRMALVRRAYELGRLRASLLRALVVVVPAAVAAAMVGGRTAFAWLPMTILAWVFANWRGGPVLRGAYVGLAGGIVTFLLPLTLLRPCCSAEAMAAGMECCRNPGMCVTAGGLLGIVLAAFIPTGPARWRTAAGVMLGVASVAILRCSTLFAAEALGLAGGLAAGILVATVSRTVLARRATAR